MANCPNCGKSALSPALILGLSFTATEPRCRHCGSYLEIGYLPLLARALIGCLPFATIATYFFLGSGTAIGYTGITLLVSAMAVYYPRISVLSDSARAHRARWLAICCVAFIVIALINAF